MLAPRVSIDEALGLLHAALDGRGAAALRRDGPSIQFRGGLGIRSRGGLFSSAFSNWNVLMPITSGVLEIAPAPGGVRVGYRVTFWQLVAVATPMVGFLAYFAGGEPGPPGGGLTLFAIAWSWLVGGNVLIARVRFPAFLRRTLADRPGTPSARG